jgi:GNAT superfamily N-acetyltransferase
MHMVTRASQQGRGAAKMLIKWGMEQAERHGVPAYLEAGVKGKPVYEKLGFGQVGSC